MAEIEAFAPGTKICQRTHKTPFTSAVGLVRFSVKPNRRKSHVQVMVALGEQVERKFTELMHQSNVDVSEMMQSLPWFLGEMMLWRILL